MRYTQIIQIYDYFITLDKEVKLDSKVILPSFSCFLGGIHLEARLFSREAIIRIESLYTVWAYTGPDSRCACH